jgi:hypothetical protein
VSDLEVILAILARIESHAAPVAVTPAQVAAAAALMGLLSDADERWFRPAVSAAG